GSREGLFVQGRGWPARAVVRRNGARRQHRLLPLVQSRRLSAVACRGDIRTRSVNGLRRQEKDTTEPCSRPRILTLYALTLRVGRSRARLQNEGGTDQSLGPGNSTKK